MTRRVCPRRAKGSNAVCEKRNQDVQRDRERSGAIPPGNALSQPGSIAAAEPEAHVPAYPIDRAGTIAKLDPKGAALESDDAGEARFEPMRRGPFTTDLDGFNVQAAVRSEANDDERRERLCRCCARPSFSLDRISQLSDGRIAYRLKYPTRGATHRIMTPVEFIARRAALIPPPRYPLVRYSGALAPHSKWRSAVIPRVPSIPRKDNSEATHGSGGKDSTRRGTAEHGTPTQLAAEGQPSKKRSPVPGTPFQAQGKRLDELSAM
ncbi:transposase [Sorangium sp. So ce321]|uniref:transposase n=1 Tax=Sorangium sp. So ce321 TaxID=3133300 RepID=UPI003F645EAD